MKTLSLVMTLLISSQLSWAYEIICPKIPLTAVSVEITPKVTFNKKTNLYKYEYTFKNPQSSKSPIQFIRMKTFQNVLNSKATAKYWSLDYQEYFNGIIWRPVSITDSEIKPGTSLSGFEFESPNPPGIMQYTVRAWKDIYDKDNQMDIIFAPGEEEKYAHDEIESDCPGVDYETRLAEVVGATIGPVPSDTLIAKLRLKKVKDKKWKGSPEREDDDNDKLEVSALETGKVQLMLFDDENIDVSKVDMASIKFGPGSAMPTKTELTKFVDHEKDKDLSEHLKKFNRSHLLMEFNIEDLKVECDLDYVIFLSATMGSKKLYGGVKVKPPVCDEVYKLRKEREKKKKSSKTLKD